VSTGLMLEVMDDAPDWLTWRERYVLMALADNFNDATRLGWPAYDGDGERSEKFRRRARCTRRQFYETLGALIDKGVLVVEVSGHNGRQAVYRIPELATAKPLPPGGRRVRENRTLEGVGEPPAEGVPEPYANPHGALPEPALGAQTPHTTRSVVCGNGASSVRGLRTPIPQDSSKLKNLKTLSSAANDPSAVPLDDSASADAPSGDGLRPRGSAAPERMRSSQDDAPDHLSPAVAAELEKHRQSIVQMNTDTIAKSIANLAKNFPDLYGRSLRHATNLGLAADLDTFNRETLRYAMQLHLLQQHETATAAQPA
jgi:hypothetical protein